MPVAFWIVTATQEVSSLVAHVLFTVTTVPLLSSKRSFGLLMFHPALSVFSSYVQFNTTLDSYFTVDPGVLIVTIPTWRKINEWVIIIKHEQGGIGFEWVSLYSIQDFCLKRDTCPVQQCMITCPRQDWKWLWLMWETKDGLSTSVLNIHEYWQIPSRLWWQTFNFDIFLKNSHLNVLWKNSRVLGHSCPLEIHIMALHSHMKVIITSK